MLECWKKFVDSGLFIKARLLEDRGKWSLGGYGTGIIMKRLLIAVCGAGVAMGVFAQGTVVFTIGNTGAGKWIHVYKNNIYNVTYVHGLGPDDGPPGTTDWTGYTLLSGSGYSAALLSAPAGGNVEASLCWASETATFRTGTAAGTIAGYKTVTLGNVPADAASCLLEIFVWDNKGGTITDPGTAWNMWRQFMIPGGTSGVFTMTAIGGYSHSAPGLYEAIGPDSLTSFCIFVPEPGILAMSGLGAAFLIFRRGRQP